MPKPHREEVREDVVAVARRRDTTLVEVAKDFGISESCLRNWIRAADIEDGNRPGTTAAESAEVPELVSRGHAPVLSTSRTVIRRAALTKVSREGHPT